MQGCGGGLETSGPTPTNEAPAPVAQAPQPAPSATPGVQEPAVDGEHDAKVKNGFYSVTNSTGIPQFYCAAAFGVLPGGEQGAGTNIYEDQGIRKTGDVFSGQAPLKAACQYERIQVDLTQSKDCRKFDWHNVLAAEVYKNPSFIPGDAFDQLEDEITYTPWSGENAESGVQAETVVECGTRKKITWSVRKYRCSGEVVKTIKVEVTETKSCCVDEPRVSFTGPTYPTYTPKLYFYDGDSSFANDCAADGGTFFQSIDGRQNVCRTPNSHGNTWDYNESGDDDDSDDDADRYKTTDPSGGTPLSGSATFYNSGSWKVCIVATSSSSKYTNNQFDHPDKDCETVTLTCGQTATKSVSYNWFGHDSEYWGLVAWRGASQASKTSPPVQNPTN